MKNGKIDYRKLEKEAEQIARRMLKEGDSVEKVMRITGLSAEQINAF